MTEKSSVDCRTDTVERRIAVSVLSSQVPSSVLSSVISPLSSDGGGRWIRTTEGVSQQIYSLPPLAAWVSLRIQFLKTPTFLHGEVDDSGHPALRPAGHSASRNVQIRSRRICRTTEDASWRLGRR